MWTRGPLVLLGAAQGFLKAAWRAARQLFHEATGTLFLVFAAIGGVSTWREWQKGSPRWLIVVTVLFTAAMVYFGVSSFFKARKVS